MNAYYGRLLYVYFSKLDETTHFDTVEEIRAYDIAVAQAIVRAGNIEQALTSGNRKVAAALRFLAEEIEGVANMPVEI